MIKKIKHRHKRRLKQLNNRIYSKKWRWITLPDYLNVISFTIPYAKWW